jgi:uncharacterized LabA/DUF88 family protein
MGRYAVFIDGGYAKKVLSEFGNPKVSYLKFSEYVANNEERLRTYYYDCAPYVSSPPTDDEKTRKSAFDRFTSALERESRFQVRLGRLAKHHTSCCGKIEYEQKMVDILFAIDLVQLSIEHQIQRAVLLLNDSDFVPAIEIARTAGTVIELYYHVPPRPHDELMRACDDRIYIDQELIDKIIR